jgi:hypothetical protein
MGTLRPEACRRLTRVWPAAVGLALLAGLAVPEARTCGAEPATSPPPGLYVRDGVLMKDGRAFRGVGANYFSLFSRLIKDPADTSSLANLKSLAQARIPFVRFMGGGFWPVDQKLYLENRAAWFERLDQVVRAAEKSGIGLIPSLFWYLPTVSDTVGEPLDQLGNPESKSIAFIRRYTAEVVERYKGSPAVWGWEFGNEYNLDADLPNARDHRPPVWPQLGTARERTSRDELKFPQMQTAFVAFAETVRKLDPTRVILSGNAMPRLTAWHNLHEKTWAADSEAQFGEILLRDNPDPMNAISVHLYPDAKGIYPGGARSIDEALGLAAKCAAGAGKPLFLGEFGAARPLGTRERQQAVFEEFLRAIEKHRIALAAFWVFDYDRQDKDWNVTFQNDRAFMLELVSQFNAKLRDLRLDGK